MTALLLNRPLYSTRCWVRSSVVDDVYKLAANLRAGDKAEVEGLGVDAKTGLRRSFRNGVLRRTYFIDGEIAAMSGLCGSMLGDIGEPYLMTSPVVERMPLTFVKTAKAAVLEMLEHKMRLEGYVAAEYTRACRLLELLGFTLGKPEKVIKGQFRKYYMVRE